MSTTKRTMEAEYTKQVQAEAVAQDLGLIEPCDIHEDVMINRYADNSKVTATAKRLIAKRDPSVDEFDDADELVKYINDAVNMHH